MRPQLRWSSPAVAAGPVYGPVSAISACLQDGAAGLATRAESAVATDAAMALTAVTAETATTMAFLIDMPSFDSPALMYSHWTFREPGVAGNRLERRALPGLAGGM